MVTVVDAVNMFDVLSSIETLADANNRTGKTAEQSAGWIRELQTPHHPGDRRVRGELVCLPEQRHVLPPRPALKYFARLRDYTSAVARSTGANAAQQQAKKPGRKPSARAAMAKFSTVWCGRKGKFGWQTHMTFESACTSQECIGDGAEDEGFSARILW
eukprot:SAG22_NODE_142_length_17922_cov_10.990406_7_plen_159_part_00